MMPARQKSQTWCQGAETGTLSLQERLIALDEWRKPGQGLRPRQGSSHGLGVCGCDTAAFSKRDLFAGDDRHQLWAPTDIYSLGGSFLLPVTS